MSNDNGPEGEMPSTNDKEEKADLVKSMLAMFGESKKAPVESEASDPSAEASDPSVVDTSPQSGKTPSELPETIDGSPTSSGSGEPEGIEAVASIVAEPAGNEPEVPDECIGKIRGSLECEGPVKFTIKPARSGIPYKERIEIATQHDLVLKKVVEVDPLKSPEDLITIEAKPVGESGEVELWLSFEPEEAKEYIFEVMYTFVEIAENEKNTSANDGKGEMRAEAKLYVSPDPRDIWKILEPEPESPYMRKHIISERLMTGEVEVLAASSRGRSHAHKAGFRDDSFGFKDAGNGWLVVCVADGAGSAEYSRRGSEIACDTCASYLSEKLSDQGFRDRLLSVVDEVTGGADDAVMELDAKALGRELSLNFQHAAYASLRVIHAEAKERGFKPDDYSTTLLLAIVKPLKKGWLFAGFAIGDGGMGVICEDGSVCRLSQPEGGEFAGETVFLTSKSVFELESDEGKALMDDRMKAFFVPSFKAAIFMTDGISDPYFEAHSKVKYDSDPHWTFLLDDLIRGDGPTGEEVSRPGPLSVNTKREEQLGSLERWSEFYMAGAHDDRTIVIVRPATAKEV